MKRMHLMIAAVLYAAMVAAAGLLWFSGVIDIHSPWWLLLLAALPAFLWISHRGIAGLPSVMNAASATVRGAAFLLAVLCLADAQYVLLNDGVSVFYLLDHSASVPEEIRTKALKYVNETAAKKGTKDEAGIIIFGETPSVEVAPKEVLHIDSIHSFVGKQYTDIQSALELASAAFGAGTRRKIVLVTDGNENKGVAVRGAEFAAANRAVIDVLPVSYDYPREVMVERLVLPDKVREKETFELRVHILSLRDTPGELVLYRNGASVAREALSLKKGRNTYTAPMQIDEAGFFTFTARVSAEADTIRENNEASGYVYIQGASRVLMAAPSELEVRYLAEACRKEGIETDIISIGDLPDSLVSLQNHDCIVLANVPAESLTENQMLMLQANVKDLGVGLVMIGGQNSFGAGGYGGTPVEDALPVTMDIKQKKINPKGALVLVLHTCEFADGNYWAKQITKKAIEAVSPQDEVGVLLYGGREEWLFPLQPAGDKKAMYAKVDTASPGDMPTFEPTLKMAHEALSKSDAMVRHVIVISDGDPASPKPESVKEMAGAGITISTVGINPHTPRDVDVLKWLAYQTGGRYYFATNPKDLPKIFVKEAKVVKRSLIFNKPFQPLVAETSELIKGVNPKDIPQLMAYVGTTAKPLASVPLVSDNENRDPVLACWRHGLGKSVAFTSDATVNWGKMWVPWDKYRMIWTQTIRWASRKRDESILNLHTEIVGGRGRLIVDAVDSKGRYVNFLRLNARAVAPDATGQMLSLRQTAPGRYEADFSASQSGVHVVNVGYQNPQTGGQGFAITGVNVPYSPEYSEMGSNFALLKKIAGAAGGRILSGDARVDRVFETVMPPSRLFRPIWERLLIAALMLFMADIVMRKIIVTRADLRKLRVALLERAGRRRSAERDSTMEALLVRKQKTFERTGDGAVKSDFRETLAAQARKSSGEAPVEAAVERSVVDDSKPVHEEPRGGDEKPREGDSYTDRLLAAKKRVQQQKKERRET